MLPGTYEPRDDGDRFHQVVRAHLDRFPADTTAAIDGVGLPRFIAREFQRLPRMRHAPPARAGLAGKLEQISVKQ